MQPENPIAGLLIRKLDPTGRDRAVELMESIQTAEPFLAGMSIDSLLAQTVAQWLTEFDGLVRAALGIGVGQFFQLFALARDAGLMTARDVLSDLSTELADNHDRTRGTDE